MIQIPYSSGRLTLAFIPDVLSTLRLVKPRSRREYKIKEPQRPEFLLPTNPKSLYHGPTIGGKPADSSWFGNNFIPQTPFRCGRLIVGRNAPLLSSMLMGIKIERWIPIYIEMYEWPSTFSVPAGGSSGPLYRESAPQSHMKGWPCL